MITTGNLKRKPLGEPQKLKILTTDKVKPKSQEDILAGLKAQYDALAKRAHVLPTRKISGAMLATGGMEGRVQNEKRKRLMALVKVQQLLDEARLKIKAEKPISPVLPIASSSELPAAPPEKKKRAYHRKKDKEIE